METFDYVIVGGGSAGCVLANRLSANGRHRVCLLEAGPADRSPFIRIPSGIIPLFRSRRYNWQYWTQPEAATGQRPLYWPRGRTLGGSSAINAMCYVRGHAWDYDHWAQLGNAGWSYADVLPYFRRSERYEPALDDAALRQWHGTQGPLNVARRRHDNPLSLAFLTAAREAGHVDNDDFNGATQDGFGTYKVFQRDGERCSNARAYLDPARDRDNLDIRSDAQACRILFEGRRAVGVRYLLGGQAREVRAGEVIVSAGAIGSPQLLMLSGIGPEAPLRALGVEMVHALRGVGENLQDHLDVAISVRARTRDAVSAHPLALGRNLAAVAAWLRRREGPLTSNIAEAGGFLRSDPAEPRPDLQMHFVPVANIRHALELSPLLGYGYSVLACDLRPESRGHIRLASTDVRDHPLIQPNYLASERDLRKLVIAVEKAREILAQPALAAHADLELQPGRDVQGRAALADWVRGHAETLYHPVGTCRMGDGGNAVVDAQLRVHGVEALRVVDASIMPTLVGGNTNAPTTMIAEKAAAMLLGEVQAGSRRHPPAEVSSLSHFASPLV